MGNLRALALASLVCLAPATAVAQSAKDKQKASEKVKQAIAKSQAGDHEAAVELYLEAYKIIPQPLLLSNIGSEYQQMKKPVEALSYFCKYLAEDPTGNNASYVTAQAKTLYIELGGVTTVSDDDVCKPIVKPAPEPPKEEPNVTAPPVTTGPVDMGSEAKASPVRWVGAGLSVVGLAAFGVGVYYGLEAKSISDKITNHDPMEPWPGDINQMEADGKSAEKKQIIFMAGGGVAFAAGVVLFFVGGPKKATESSTGVSFVPVATGDQMGMAAFGRF